MICNNCGQFFDEHDIAHYTEDYGETFSACPYCGSSDIGDSLTCEICGEEFDADELRDGFCLTCLWEAIDYDVALAYANYVEGLADLILCQHFNANVAVKSSSVQFETFLTETFNRLKENDLLLGTDSFLQTCRIFCLPFRTSGWDPDAAQFAEWYAEYRKEHGDQDE